MTACRNLRALALAVFVLSLVSTPFADDSSSHSASFPFKAEIKTPSSYGGVEKSGHAPWQHILTHEGADALAIEFTNFDLGPGDVLFVSDSVGKQLQVFESNGPKSDGSFTTDPIAGDSVLIELSVVSAKGGKGFSIPRYHVTTNGVDAQTAQYAEVLEAYNQVESAPQDFQDEAERVIYGADDRLDVYEVSDPDLLRLVDACVIVTDTGSLTDNMDGTYSLATAPWTSIGGTALCVDEPYAGQLLGGFCSGFLVGEDLIVTAGHCGSTAGDCGSLAFVFGFSQQGATTPPETAAIPADNVYFCDGIIDTSPGGAQDHSLIRLDRPVVGHEPIPVRRTDSATNGDPLVMVGHPVGLPMKVAGGAVVKDAATGVDSFTANLDAYGGNSGSMVVNMNDFVIEGILVRGNTDFVLNEGCVVSNMLSDDNGSFEDSTKMHFFSDMIPELISSEGRVDFDRVVYSCDDTVTVDLDDLDLLGDMTASVVVTTLLGGDSETLELNVSPADSGKFTGTLPTVAGMRGFGIPDNMMLEVADGDTLTVTYMDADDGTMNPAVATDMASIDCVAPMISNVMVSNISGVSASVTFDTNENATAGVMFGTDCGVLDRMASSSASVTSHSVLLTGLTPLTDYFFSVSATDPAGNTASDDNMGACFNFSTPDQPDYYTELFSGDDNDLSMGTWKFTPDASISFYSGCLEPAAAFPTDPATGTVETLADDGSATVNLAMGMVSLYGIQYATFHINANGNITFDATDGDFSETLDEHFGEPRIAALWDDLNPSAGGTISWEEFADRAVVTWQGVPQFGQTDSHSFQVEMFFDGTITITILERANTDGLIGLSAGTGLPADFVESDFSAYGGCVVSRGELDMDKEFYTCSDLINMTLRDSDLAGNMTQNVMLAATSGASLQVTLVEIPAASGRFVGSVDTVPVRAGDPALAIMDGDTITATYMDEDTGSGPEDITATATADCAFPVISNVMVTGVTATQATITFDTNEPTEGGVDFGPGCGDLSSMASGPSVTSHSIDLMGLTPNTSYYFGVSATDGVGNIATDDNGGNCYSFFTPGAAGSVDICFSGPSVAIPDDNPAGVAVMVNAAGLNGPILDVDFEFTGAGPCSDTEGDTNNGIDHSWVGDLIITLTSPMGTTVTLADRIGEPVIGTAGNRGNNFCSTLLDDEAGTIALEDADNDIGPFSGSWTPAEALSAFDGEDGNGDWILTVSDNAGQDVGGINGFCIRLTLDVPVPEIPNGFQVR